CTTLCAELIEQAVRADAHPESQLPSGLVREQLAPDLAAPSSHHEQFAKFSRRPVPVRCWYCVDHERNSMPESRTSTAPVAAGLILGGNVSEDDGPSVV